MENNFGKICPVCNSVINEMEESVVCNNCNIAYHKHCWNNNGGCINPVCAKRENRCPKCAAIILEGQRFCSECGEPQKKTCLGCGAELQPDQLFCIKCGRQVEGANVQQNFNPSINQFNANIQNAKSNKKLIPIIIGAVCVVIILFMARGNSKINFNKEFGYLDDGYYCDIAEDGSWMKIDTNPFDRDDYYSNKIDVQSVNRTLGLSSSVYQKMLETRSIDGRQRDENDKVEVSWTYHPDKGLEVLYEVKD